jgi:hypothetical protein
MDANDLCNMRRLLPDGSASSSSKLGVPWVTQWRGPELIVFGHDAVAGLQVTPHAIGLDTGCCYGKQLTAVILPERRIVSVQAAREYSPPNGPK